MRCALLLLCLVLAACGPAPAPAAPTAPAQAPAPAPALPPPTGDEPAVIEVEPLRVEVLTGEDGRREVVVVDARDLFDEANQALSAGRPEQALHLYDRLAAEFSDSRLLAPSLYNAGLALEALGRLEEAVARYRLLVERAPDGRDAVDALVREGAVLAELERWSDARKVFDELLARADLTDSDRIEGMARRGYVLLEARDYPAAERELEAALAAYRSARQRGHLETDYYVAMAHFYLGEIPRRQFQAIPIRLPDDQLRQDVEQKAELVLLAGERYTRAIRTGNMHWATAAGYRLASMQRDFWAALVQAPIPPELSAQAAAIYVEEVQRLAARHLEQALSIHSRNVELSERAKVSTPWTEGSRREIAEVTQLLARARAGERVLPASDTAPEPSDWLAAPDAYVPGRIEL